MTRPVLDASAVLATIYGEDGADAVLELFASGAAPPVMSSVNLNEVLTRLMRDGLSLKEAQRVMDRFSVQVMPFGDTDAYAAAELYEQAAARRLSFGDRACLALAISTGAVAWTADRVWGRLALGAQINVIRE